MNADIEVGQTTSNGWTMVCKRMDSGCELAVFTGPPSRRDGLKTISVELNREEIFRAATPEGYERLFTNLGDLAQGLHKAQNTVNRLIMDAQMGKGS